MSDHPKVSEPSAAQAETLVDPGILEIIGALTGLIGMVEQVRRLGVFEHHFLERRHKNIWKAMDKACVSITDARSALTVLRDFTSKHMSNVKPDIIGVAVPREQLPIYEKAMADLYKSIQNLHKDCCNLERLTSNLQRTNERYFRASDQARRLLNFLGNATKGEREPGAPDLPQLIEYVEAELKEFWSRLTREGDL